MNVVGLDLSLTATGVATKDGTFTIKPTMTGVHRLAYVRNELLARALGADVDVAAIEGYSFGSPNQSTHIGELGGVVQTALLAVGIPFVLVPPSSLKKYATSSGKATKPDMRMALFTRTGIDERDDNKVDAAWLRMMALDHYGEPLVTMPAANREALAKVAWPVIGAEVSR